MHSRRVAVRVASNEGFFGFDSAASSCERRAVGLLQQGELSRGGARTAIVPM
jgi:hypothetical protein